MTDYTSLPDDGLVEAIERLELHADEAAAALRRAKDELLNRKRHAIQAAYEAKGEAFGAIHFEMGGKRIDVTVSRRVEWDQGRLEAIEATIRDEWKGDAGEFIDRRLSVKESKYKAWPSDLRATFEPARVVKAATPTVSIKPATKE